jgi:hypothetical protein
MCGGEKEKIQKCRQRVSAYPLSRFNMVCLCLSVCQNGLLFLFVRPLLSGCTVFTLAANGLGLCEVGAFKAQMFNLAQMFIRITNA